MASEKQISANRRNAKKSTGPKTEQGKARSRQNAFRHGLTAETIIEVVEDPASYEAFEAEIRADYEPQGAVETSLVIRLASLLWRLRRATAIESGLLQIQAKILLARKTRNCARDESATGKVGVIHSLIPTLAWQTQIETFSDQQRCRTSSTLDETLNMTGSVKLDLARSFWRLANVDSGVFDRLGRYEKSLWRQTAQIIFLLNSFKRRSENSRRRRARRLRVGQQRRKPFFPAHFFDR